MGKASTSASKIVKTRRKELFRLPEGTDDDADDDAKGTDDAADSKYGDDESAEEDEFESDDNDDDEEGEQSLDALFSKDAMTPTRSKTGGSPKTNPNVPTCDSSDDGDAEDGTRLIPGDCMQLLDQPPLSEVQIAACELFGENFTFRDEQEKCVSVLVGGESVLALHPAGWGKTLILMVTVAMRPPGVTLLFVPLKALMLDLTQRINSLGRKNVDATFINGDLTSAQKAEVWAQMRAAGPGDKRLVVCLTPEMYASSPATLSAIMQTYKKRHLQLVMIDEVHTISEMGHDFRPTMLVLKDIPRVVPGVPLYNATATATFEVADDIKDMFDFGSCASFYSSRVPFSRRETLKYAVVKVISAAEKQQVLLRLVEAIRRRNADWGRLHPDVTLGEPVTKPAVLIIFTRTIKQTESLASAMVDERKGDPSLFVPTYHSQLSPTQKEFTIDLIRAGAVDAVVSTSALECGQDIATIAGCAQAEQSTSLIQAAQGFGRAGRSNAFSRDSPGLAVDVYQRNKFLGSLGPSILKRHGKGELIERLAYLENIKCCRLGILCRHFGGDPPERCGSEGHSPLCDICAGEGPKAVEQLSLTDWTKLFTNQNTGILTSFAAKRVEQRPSVRKIVEHMRVDRRSEWIEHGLTEDKAVCIVHQLLIHGVLDVDCEERPPVMIPDANHEHGVRVQRRTPIVFLREGFYQNIKAVRTASPPQMVDYW